MAPSEMGAMGGGGGGLELRATQQEVMCPLIWARGAGGLEWGLAGGWVRCAQILGPR